MASNSGSSARAVCAAALKIAAVMTSATSVWMKSFLCFIIAASLLRGFVLILYQINGRNAELPAQLTELVEINRADDINDGEFLRVCGDDNDPADLRTRHHHHIDFGILAILLAFHADHSR